MAVSVRHMWSQGPMFVALGRAAASALRSPAPAPGSGAAGQWVEGHARPPPAALIRDYVRHVGGDPAWYKGRIPAHLFPQWGLPFAARALALLSYPLARVVNAGCRLENRAPLPAGERLQVRARVQSVDDDGRRAIVTQRIITGTSTAPDAVVADVRAYIPIVSRPKGSPRKHESPSRSVPGNSAHEIAFLRVRANAGLDFAKLTGDFNPVHWLPAYARASGFRTCILHGFSTLARAIESLHRARLCGDPSRLAAIDVSFTRPLILPASVGVYVSGERDLWVGDAPHGRVYLEGRFDTGPLP